MTLIPKFMSVLTTDISVKILKSSLMSKLEPCVSSCQLRKYLGITQKSAYYLLDDIRNGLKQSNFIKEMLKDFVELDETYVGGSNTNRHWDKKVPNSQVPNVRQDTLEPLVRANVKGGINHRKKQYAKGKVSVNSAENFNGFLKGGIRTYHWISKKYTQKYTDEFAFRFNTRKYGEQERFEFMLSSIMGKSLGYGELI
ncbi:2117_t:CDS:2 [Cetraspora pellucida]|uniref:2117_t:CDS:1 n=1 Tax=Cetraspora pellucida TaxID=1433469 RepID=A0ACA9N181_9GLOM|nr:2117_t:CDS:2 [Cetraspora pellucida]